MRRGRLAPAMISMPGHRGPEGANVEPCQPGCHPGKREAEPLRGDPFRLRSFATAQEVARARWRRCFAFSLALRLLARIVALASSMRLQSGWDQAILSGT